MRRPSGKVLSFSRGGETAAPAVGHVHADGSVTFRGTTYGSIRELPPDCQALRLDQETYKQWKSIYRAIAPHSPGRQRPVWLRSE